MDRQAGGAADPTPVAAARRGPTGQARRPTGRRGSSPAGHRHATDHRDHRDRRVHPGRRARRVRPGDRDLGPRVRPGRPGDRDRARRAHPGLRDHRDDWDRQDRQDHRARPDHLGRRDHQGRRDHSARWERESPRVAVRHDHRGPVAARPVRRWQTRRPFPRPQHRALRRWSPLRQVASTSRCFTYPLGTSSTRDAFGTSPWHNPDAR